MRNRVMGEEIEWGGGYRPKSEDAYQSMGLIFGKIEEVMALETEHEYHPGSNVLGFINNGARVYLESTGQHLETASPECSGALETLKFDKWSETFVCKIAEELKENIGKLVFYKKNSDSNLEYTRGCHENYFSEKIFEELLKESENSLMSAASARTVPLISPEINYFILFLITRQIFTGSGGIMLYSLKKQASDIYEISPRTFFIDAVLSSPTTASGNGGRAIINTRNEPLSHQKKYWRNHLILGDANMADLSIFLKFGTTSAIIEMIEEGSWDDDLLLDNPADAPGLLKKISQDLTLENVPIRLKNGKNYTALQIQKKFYKNWRRYLQRTNQGGEKLEIAGRWQEILGRLEIDDESLYSQLDWKIKMRLIRNFMDRKGLPLQDKSVISIDNLYHNPDPTIGLYYKLKNRPGANFLSLVSESEIAEAGRVPPNTRAKLRVYLKKLCDELELSHSVDWNCVTFRSKAQIGTINACEHKIHMFDPRLSSPSSLNSPENAEAIKYLNALKPNAIIV